ncbi:thiolase family protein [Variovorax sp. J31P207]|uniref:thiolase family protein n=1 Tax=Variovorax sp. J31P207 TaxID=3053510 RepID=UPI00257564BA|nr:thiolase family protein [Variovorax sp. J31P207]MDM0072691.1 thiolase family protein [Variovorax sp. J31P207]
MAERRQVAVVGVGQTDFGALYAQKDAQRDEYALGAEALKLALEDAGLRKDELDGLLTSRIGYEHGADMLGLPNLRVVNGLEGSGRMSGVSFQNAVSLIETGQADVVACVYGNNGRSVQMTYGGYTFSPTSRYDAMYGMTSPGAYVGMMYRRYQHLYGVPDGALAPIAINNRRNAVLNPVAVMREEITEAQYLSSRYIADPLRLYDYCIINDGGVAVILTTLDRAKDLRKRPVRVAATAAMGALRNHYTSPDFFYAASQDVARRVYEASGYGPDDMDCVQIYDNFTPTVLFSLEGFNHAPRGEAWRWATLDRIGLKGETPINTAGGHTAESYMQGWGHHVEAVRQLRGEAGARQVADCHVAQYICASPIVTSHILVGE